MEIQFRALVKYMWHVFDPMHGHGKEVHMSRSNVFEKHCTYLCMYKLNVWCRDSKSGTSRKFLIKQHGFKEEDILQALFLSRLGWDVFKGESRR